MIRASRLTARPLTARRLTAYRLGQTGPFDPLILFRNAEEGTFLDFTSPQVYADTAGTDPAEVGEGIAFVDDKSPNDTDSTQITSTARPIFARVPVGGRRNLLERTEEFDNAYWSKSSVTVTTNDAAAPNGETTADRLDYGLNAGAAIRSLVSFPAGQYTFSIWLRSVSGTTPLILLVYNATDGTRSTAITATETWTRFSLTVTNTVATDNFQIRTGDGAVAQSVYAWGAQLELGSTATPYQKVVTQYDITESGIPSVHHSVWDNTDDILPITLPAITGGTVALVGLNGIWIEDNWDYAGGTLSIGPTTIAGLPAGILDVVGDLCAVIINDRAWTAAERAGVVAWGKARGAPGVFSLGPELVTNGDFSDGLTGWTDASLGTGTATVTDGELVIVGTDVSNRGIASQRIANEIGATYEIRFTRTGSVNIGVSTISGANANVANPTGSPFRYTATDALPYINAYANSGGSTGNLDNISVRKLELLP